ncbi:type I restriction endonuclease subunit R [Burkholderia sola]|uniref:type I restriction endonuclease subunit R n=1 Tax=Burkholderia sola TaxID=2843302 RepID=UPI001C0A92E8|nr:HsdR family type I site-specific deoxyribonuclease [Burkholderia cenocepacia]CAG2258225.1 HsdR family type I site-specific deoxyribonuclease [Burkholderia cenocepacia]CAG2258248.1 HsdR family type I site-specific deoxyribonuclease [Burkholderia cenocepacia]CAG2258316.1 HsdR family type I site-specific deoxyribonuclease [Burkholderia cenocepacia]CAG2258324.1 HsdR family type I site-specific deoxyribonuclease [Burkholderia cenocepacia]
MSAPPQTREQYSAHIPALHLLINLGWSFLTTAQALALRGSTREVILKTRLIEVLQTRRFDYKGEWFPLSPSGIDQILRQVQTVNLPEGLLSANERVYQILTLGVTVTEFMSDGKRHQPTIALVDWNDAAANRWDVTEELEVLSTHGTHYRAPDVVAYVNGLPLVVIEAKRPDATHAGQAMVDEGISQQLRNQRPDEIPQLFAYAQLLLAVSHTEGRYGTTGTPLKFWARWREEQFGDAQLSEWKNRPLSTEAEATLLADKPAKLQTYFRELWAQPLLPTDQDRLLAAMLHPQRLLEYLRLFVLFDRKVGKVVARYQQFFGIRALLERVNQRTPDGGREGGVVWHTTGSGKSFTMIFLTKALVLHQNTQTCRVIVVTDRLDLEDQLARNFMNSGAFGSAVATKKDGEKAKVSSGRELAKRIGQGSERIIFTLIHKFATASKLPECYNPSADVIVLVDEGHRSHGGETHERMRKALPRAAYVAFTGTPLLKKGKTANKFGPIVHAYTMQRAVEDGTVTPLLYEERVPELTINEEAVNRWFDRITAGLSPEQAADLKRKFASKQAVYGAVNRIELIAWDIAQHFNENIKKLGLGLKGQVATASKLEAIHYKQYLDDSGLVSSAVIISAPDSREGNTEVDESKLPEVQKWWNTHVGKNADGYEQQVLQDFGGDGEPDLLIVVDRLLTGFDEPRNTVLYIDKPLKEHNLIQAVARVNRLHEAKRYGVLVDYRGILKELDTAVRAYQDLESRTQGGYELADIEGLYQQMSTEYKRLPGLHDELWAIFAEVQNKQDLEQYRQLLMPRYAEDEDGQTYDTRQKVRDDFYRALTAFGLCLQTALSSRSFFEDHSFSEADVHRYKEDLRFFIGLRTIARQDALETVDYSVYEEQIRRLVDKQVIGSQIREPEGVYLVHQLGQPEAAEQWSEEKTRNETDMIRTRLKKTIEQDLADDPYAQKVFADLLKQAIAEAEAMFDHPLKQYALFKKFEEQVEARDIDGLPAELSDNKHVRAYFGICRLVLGKDAFAHTDQAVWIGQAKEIDAVVQQAVAEHSLNPQNIEAAIRKALLPKLFGLMGLDIAKEAIDQVIQVTRVGLARSMT